MDEKSIEKSIKESYNELIADLIHPKIISAVEVIRALGDGVEHSWSEIQEKASVSPRTLTSVLKILLQHKFVKRRIVPDFPPRANYTLTDGFLKKIGYFLQQQEESLYLHDLTKHVLKDTMTPDDFLKLSFTSYNYTNLYLMINLLIATPEKRFSSNSEEGPSSDIYMFMGAAYYNTKAFLSLFFSIIQNEQKREEFKKGLERMKQEDWDILMNYMREYKEAKKLIPIETVPLPPSQTKTSEGPVLASIVKKTQVDDSM